MALVLIENKKLQSSIKDLEVKLTRASCWEEVLEVKVLAFDKQRQLLKVENRLLTERLRCGAN